MKIEIKIEDFPDNIHIKLEKSFLRILFNKIKKQTSQRDLAKEIGVTELTLSQWKLNRKGIKGRFIPIKAIRKIKDKIKNISWKEIEKNIIEYKSKNDRKSIKNPTIPIKDSKELREVITHIMADGCDRHYAAYYGYGKEEKREFAKEIKQVFGDVEINYHQDHLNFPMAIPRILSHYFKINFLSEKCRVPEIFLKTNKNQLIAVVRAMIIDEGTIDGPNIRMDSSNKKFLEDIKKACNILNIKCGKTWESNDGIFKIYRFNILAESIQKVHNKITPLPIKKKEYLLSFACENQKRNWKYELPGETKKKIVIELLKKPSTSVELSYRLKIPRKIINKNTKYLEKKDLIKKNGKKIYTTIYKIKNKTLAKEFIEKPENFLGGNKLKTYGKTQLKVLKLLNKNKYYTYSELLNLININKAAMYKCLKGMTKKRAIKKQNRKYYLNKYGKNILNLPENKARYALYANIKDLSKIDLNGFGV